MGFGSQQFVGALSLNRTHTLFNEKLNLGYGLRYNFHTATDQKFITAPFIYTAESQIDTMTISSVSTSSVSATINIGYSITNKLMLGFNIDAIGFSFGKEQDVRIFQWVDDPSGATQTATTAKPTSANVLLVGDNDIGSLNSEFFVKYNFTESLGARLGMSMFFSEYTTQLSGFDGNKRFRNKLSYPFVALSVKL